MGYLHRKEWLAYAFLVVAALAVSIPLYPYRWHTFLHIAGAVVFLGNIIVTAAWMLMAERTRSTSVIHFSAKAVIYSPSIALAKASAARFCQPGERVGVDVRRHGRAGVSQPIAHDDDVMAEQ